MADFMKFDDKDLEWQLGPDTANRLLSKDIQRRQSLPRGITEGAKETDVVSILFYANASAGDFTSTVTLTGYNTTPLVMAWFMGCNDKSGTTYPGGGILASSFNSSSSVSGTAIFSGAEAAYTAQSDSIVFGITSTNVGWSEIMVAHFLYAVYSDNTDLSRYGVNYVL